VREPDKTSVTEVAKKHRIGEQTIYKWRRQRGTLEPADIRRLRGLETENAKLKRRLAERDAQIFKLKARREPVAMACERGLSQRPACQDLEVARSAVRYESVRRERDVLRVKGMERLAAQYPRYAYRGINIFLRREDFHMSRHRAHRLWRVAERQVPRQRRPPCLASSRQTPIPGSAANFLRAYDFVFDACANGQSLVRRTTIDEFTRESLAIDVDSSIHSQRVIELLARLISERGLPCYLRSDNVAEFMSEAVLDWLGKAAIETAMTDPGKPWQNAMSKSFNARLRDKCPSLECFRRRREAKAIIET
jgi:putative transposase